MFEIAAYAFASWGSLYGALCWLQPKRSYEWHCRSVTVVHAILSVSLCAWAGFIEGPWPFTDPGGPNTPLQVFIASISLGYFLFDMIWCLYFRTEGPTMLIHHAVSIIGIAGVLIRGICGTEVIGTIFGAEFTNPFLQMRWFLRESDSHRTWYGELNDWLFVCTFGLMRIVIGSYFLYTYLLHLRPDILSKMCACIFYSIGWVFWIAILQYAVRKYKRQRAQNGDKTSSKKDAQKKDVRTDKDVDTGGSESEKLAGGDTLTSGLVAELNGVHHNDNGTSSLMPVPASTAPSEDKNSTSCPAPDILQELNGVVDKMDAHHQNGVIQKNIKAE